MYGNPGLMSVKSRTHSDEVSQRHAIMNLKKTGRYFRDFVCLSLFVVSAKAPVHGVEYLITNTLGGTAMTAQNYTANTGVQTLQMYFYLNYSSTEAGTIQGFTNGSIQASVSAPVTTYISPSSNFTANNSPGYNGQTWASTTTNYTGGTGNAVQGTISYVPSDPGGGFPLYILDPAGGSILLGSSVLSIDTSQASTQSSVSVGTDGQQWVGYFGGTPTDVSVTGASFLVSVAAVPEPSTYATAALACIALGGVALKKRRTRLQPAAKA